MILVCNFMHQPLSTLRNSLFLKVFLVSYRTIRLEICFSSWVRISSQDRLAFTPIFPFSFSVSKWNFLSCRGKERIEKNLTLFKPKQFLKFYQCYCRLGTLLGLFYWRRLDMGYVVTLTFVFLPTAPLASWWGCHITVVCVGFLSPLFLKRFQLKCFQIKSSDLWPFIPNRCLSFLVLLFSSAN